MRSAAKSPSIRSKFRAIRKPQSARHARFGLRSAPAEPSSQDRAVVATAARSLAEAQGELQELQREKLEAARSSGGFEQPGAGDDDAAEPASAVAFDAGILVDRAV